jgi:cold shock CspA family protein
MQFTGTVKTFDADEAMGTIVRDGDRHVVNVTSRGLALGVGALDEGDRVEFDVDLGVDPQARNVIRC